MRRPALSFVVPPLVLVLAAAVAIAGGRHHVTRRIPLAGDGGWDYLTMDVPGHRLFVSHSTRVEVVDVKDDRLVGRIEDTPGVHGIAFAPDLGRGFVSNGRDSSVTVFTLDSLRTHARIPVPASNPDAILYDPASKRVFTFGGRSANAAVIDAAAGTVVGSIPLGGKPEFAVVDGRGMLYVNIEDRSEIAAIDTRALEVKATWPIAPGEEPSGLAFDREHHRLFAVCGNEKLVVVDPEKGRVVATLPIGKGVDGVAFDDRRGLIFSSNGEGTMTVIREKTPDVYEVVETVTTERGARTCAVDPGTATVYTATADFGPPPAATADRPHPRPSLVPGTFRVLAVGE